MNAFIAEHPYLFAIIVIFALSTLGDVADRWAERGKGGDYD